MEQDKLNLLGKKTEYKTAYAPEVTGNIHELSIRITTIG